jgi:hypothetical protein
VVPEEVESWSDPEHPEAVISAAAEIPTPASSRSRPARYLTVDFLSSIAVVPRSVGERNLEVPKVVSEA